MGKAPTIKIPTGATLVTVTCPECGQRHERGVKWVMGFPLPQGRSHCAACVERLTPVWRERERERQAEEAARQAAQEIETRRTWLYQSGVTLRYRGKTFEATGDMGFQKSAQPKAFKGCREYAAGLTPDTYRGYRSLVLSSPEAWGVGKTHLACSIAQDVIARWPTNRMRPVLVTTEAGVYLRIQASYKPSQYGEGETEERIIKELTSVPLLVLDDIGKEPRRDMDFVRRTLYSVVNGRYNNRLPMVVTANLTEQEMREYLGGTGNQATLDRLVEMAGGHIEVMTGKSWRRKYESK